MIQPAKGVPIMKTTTNLPSPLTTLRALVIRQPCPQLPLPNPANTHTTDLIILIALKPHTVQALHTVTITTLLLLVHVLIVQARTRILHTNLITESLLPLLAHQPSLKCLSRLFRGRRRSLVEIHGKTTSHKHLRRSSCSTLLTWSPI